MPPPRSALRPGVCVLIVQKQDQPTGRLTRGFVHRTLTGYETHPHGIKVELSSGQVGRVQSLAGEGDQGGEEREGGEEEEIPAAVPSFGPAWREAESQATTTKDTRPVCRSIARTVVPKNATATASTTTIPAFAAAATATAAFTAHAAETAAATAATIAAATTASTATASTATAEASDVDSLASMGFQRGHAAEALRRCGGESMDAVNLLLEHGETGMDIFVAERGESSGWGGGRGQGGQRGENKYDQNFPAMGRR
jgi:uncharacterized repeat protein (TIGR03833 family)